MLATTSGLAFLAFFCATALNVALPELATSVGANLGLVSWTVTGYVTALAAGLIAAGRLADAAGRRRLLAWGALLFALASVACALASSAAALIAARAIQGAAAALITPASFGLLVSATPANRRARAVGIWSSAAATSAFLGPSLGGVIVDLAGWRALFALAAAVASVLAVVTTRLPRLPEPRRRQPPAMRGVLVGGVAVTMLLLATAQGSEWGWTDPRTVAGVAGGGVGAAVGVLGAGKPAWRAVDAELLGRRTFAVANALSIVFAFAAFSWLLAAPLFVATVWNWDALAAASSVAPGAAVAALAAWGAGRLSERGRMWAIVLGSVLLAGTALALTEALGPSPDLLAVWLPAGITTGIAVGAVLASLSAVIADSVPARDFAQGAAINMTARQLGGALGVALVAALVGAHGGSEPSQFTALWIVIGSAGAITAVGGAVLLGRADCRSVRLRA